MHLPLCQEVHSGLSLRPEGEGPLMGFLLPDFALLLVFEKVCLDSTEFLDDFPALQGRV